MFRYFGPYTILQKIGSVAYELALPSSSRIHPVFHVSQLRRCLSPTQQVISSLPALESDHQIPVKVLQHRVIPHGQKTILQVLVHWSDSSPDLATWEDKDALQQVFPYAPAWGQAVSKGGGNVSDTS